MNPLTNKYVVLIEEAKAFSDQAVEDGRLDHYMPPYVFQKDIRTLVVKASRRSGHSEALLKILDKYPSALLITHTMRQCDDARRQHRTMHHRITSIARLHHDTCGYNFGPYVLVDGASQMTAREIDEIYQRFSLHRDTFFVLFG